MSDNKKKKKKKKKGFLCVQNKQKLFLVYQMWCVCVCFCKIFFYSCFPKFFWA